MDELNTDTKEAAQTERLWYDLSEEELKADLAVRLDSTEEDEVVYSNVRGDENEVEQRISFEKLMPPPANDNADTGSKTIFDKLRIFWSGIKSEMVIERKPYSFSITSNKESKTSLSNASQVNVFMAETALYIDGFGNKGGEFSFNYLSNDYYGGGEMGYRALLYDCINRSIRIGRIVMESKNLDQLSALLTISDFDSTGAAVTHPPLLAKLSNDGKRNGTIEFDVDVTFYGGTILTYKHIPGNTVTFYFYPATDSLPLYPLIDRLKKCYRIFMGTDLYAN